MPPESLVNVLEAALLAAGRALTLDDLNALFVGSPDAPDRKQLREGLAQLEESLSGRGIELVEVASGYRLQVRKEYSSWLAGLFSERPPRYSRALLETLALITYRQPITRGEIEEVRGVAVSSNIIKTLMEREWIRVLGHREVPGRPALYGTTREFLDHFGLKSLEGLPPLAEIRDLDQVAPDLFAPSATETNNGQQQSTGEQPSSDPPDEDANGDALSGQQQQDQAPAGDTGVGPDSDAPSANESESEDLEGDNTVESVELGASVDGIETGDQVTWGIAQSDDMNTDVSVADDGHDGKTLSGMDDEGRADDDSGGDGLEAGPDEDELPVSVQSGDTEQVDHLPMREGGETHSDIDGDGQSDRNETADAGDSSGNAVHSNASPGDVEPADEHENRDESMNEPSDESGRGELDDRR